MWDVAVVGSGPAGAAAALAAARAGARVVLVDRAEFPRDKVCGDGIAPQALDVLAGLGVDVAAVTEGFAPVGRLRLESPGGVVVAREMRRPAYVIPRTVFDARLRAAALAAGVVPRTQRVRSVRVRGSEVLLDGELRARVVIGADGAESVVRREIGVPRPRPGTVALAIRGYAPLAGYDPGEQLLRLTARHWPAYAWVFPIGDGRANIGYGELLTGRPPSREHLIDRLRELLPGVTADPLRAHRLPLSTGRPRFAHGRVLLAGDAAGLINPLTGEGICYAVTSGALAGQAATEADPAAAYQRALRRRLSGHLLHTDLVALLGARPSLLDGGLAAAANDQRVFDTMVEFGLGVGKLSPRAAGALLRSLPAALASSTR